MSRVLSSADFTRLHFRGVSKTLVVLGVLVAMGGCTSSEPTKSEGEELGPEQLVKSGDELAATGESAGTGTDPFAGPTTSLPDGIGPYENMLGGTPGRNPAASPAPIPQAPDASAEELSPGFELADASDMRASLDGDAKPAKDKRVLRNDFTVERLIQYLQDCDLDMKLIHTGKSGITDPVKARSVLQQVAKRKSEASVLLQNHVDATTREKSLGHRGQLQALSYLASTGDFASAKALRSLAESNLSSTDGDLIMESRIVLIGFALDSLQAGQEGAADEVVRLVESLTTSQTSDVPAVLILGQAREMLSRYGQFDQAAAVRTKIFDLYGESSDATIAQIAAQAAGSAKFDVADRLLVKILESENVALSRWATAATELITDSPDMNSVQYLAQAALKLEAAGRDTFVDETFAVMKEQFDDLDSATAREVETAELAHQARQDVVGQLVDLSLLPTVGGTGVDQASFKDKLVLMPFWAISLPASLEIVGLLRQIQAEMPDQLSIVGMNLDPEGAPLQEFLAEAKPDFPSYRSVSSSTAEIANPIAARFGLVSFPFVAILDDESRVLALDFTGQNLKQKILRLLQDR